MLKAGDQTSAHRDVLKTVRRIEIATRRTVNAELAGRYHSVFKGQGMAFAEVRPYTPGDDIRHIDWNVSARHQNQGAGLYVKQFVEERELTVMLLVDLSASNDFGTKKKSKRQLLAELGALVAFSAIKNQDRVGLVLYTDRVELYVPPRKGRSHVLRVIREIVEAQPEGKGSKLGDALAYFNRVQKRRSVCFVLSDFLDAGYEPALKVAMAKHDVVLMRVSDAAERALPDLGIVEMVDAETNRPVLVDTSSPRVRAIYERRRIDELAQAGRRLKQIGADLIDLQSEGDYVAPLVSFFRARSARLRSGR
jgi:uncharacterized protein (DUF58 family)